MTQAQRSHLLNHGYAVVEDLIDDTRIERVRGEIHEVVDGIARAMHAEGLIPESWSDQG